jgi:hypothetical protein
MGEAAREAHKRHNAGRFADRGQREGKPSADDAAAAIPARTRAGQHLVVDSAAFPWQYGRMPGRRDRDEPAGLGYWVGSSVLRTVAHASMLAAGTMGIAALIGSAAVGLPGVAVAGAVGVAAMAGAEALRSRAAQATQRERCEREAEIQRENAAVDAAIYAMEAEEVKADHVRRLLTRQQEPQFRSTGKGV